MDTDHECLYDASFYGLVCSIPDLQNKLEFKFDDRLEVIEDNYPGSDMTFCGAIVLDWDFSCSKGETQSIQAKWDTINSGSTI